MLLCVEYCDCVMHLRGTTAVELTRSIHLPYVPIAIIITIKPPVKVCPVGSATRDC